MRKNSRAPTTIIAHFNDIWEVFLCISFARQTWVYYLVESSGGSVSSDGSGSGSGSDTGTSGSESGVGGNVGVSGNVSVGGNVNVNGNIQIGVDDELKNPLSRLFSAIAGYFEKKTGSASDEEQTVVIPEPGLPVSVSDGGLPAVVEGVRLWGSQLSSLYTGYTGFLGDIFPYFPSELQSLFSWGLAAIVVAGVMRKVFWR